MTFPPSPILALLPLRRVILWCIDRGSARFRVISINKILPRELENEGGGGKQSRAENAPRLDKICKS